MSSPTGLYVERTFAIIKPDAVESGHCGAIINRVLQEDFNIVGMRKIEMTTTQAAKFYAVHQGKPFFEDLVKFMTSGPVVVMALEREDAIQAWRDLMGATNPEKAAPGTLRKLYGTDVGRNATHGSDAPETAKAELELFFPYLE